MCLTMVALGLTFASPLLKQQLPSRQDAFQQGREICRRNAPLPGRPFDLVLQMAFGAEQEEDTDLPLPGPTGMEVRRQVVRRSRTIGPVQLRRRPMSLPHWTAPFQSR